jgi:hypothetical protein
VQRDLKHKVGHILEISKKSGSKSPRGDVNQIALRAQVVAALNLTGLAAN